MGINSKLKCIRSIRRKPMGGFCFIRVRSVLAAWYALTQGFITVYDLRLWLGSHEVKSRRCKIRRACKAYYRYGEILLLVGTGNLAKVKGSIHRLQEAGLLSWSEDAVSVSTEAFESTFEDSKPWCTYVDAIQNNRRRIPVPRRVIRYLAKTRSKTVIATVLATMIRCLYYDHKAKQCCSGGRVKVSWITDVFGLGLSTRNVKAARKALMQEGILRAGQAGQLSLNRWGLPMEINLTWGLRIVTGASKATPRQERIESKIAPLYNQELLSRGSYQTSKPAVRSAGIKDQVLQERPTLKRLAVQDLKAPDRLDDLYRQAIEAGVIRSCPAHRLLWFAAAEHALTAGQHNPCGLFTAVYRRKLWEYITQQEEDAARRKLNLFDYGGDSQVRGSDWDLPPDYLSVAA